ncbi:MAG: hypothetical protein ABII80_02195 [bacterium]
MSKKKLFLTIIFSVLAIAIIFEVTYFLISKRNTSPLSSESSPTTDSLQPLPSTLPTTIVPPGFDKIEFNVNKLRADIDSNVISSATLTTSIELSLGEIKFFPNKIEGIEYQLTLIDGNTGYSLNYLSEDLEKITVINQHNQNTSLSITDLTPGELLTIKTTYDLLYNIPTVESVTIVVER